MPPMRAALGPLLALSLVCQGSGFFPGTTMEGSQQLEAYIGYKCQEGKSECRHMADLRHIYAHTNEDGLDHKLTLGELTYLATSVRTAAEGSFDVYIHRGNFSSSADSAVASAVGATTVATLQTVSCADDTFQEPLLFISIVRSGVAAASFDFSFALKKSMIGPDKPSLHVLPAQLMTVLAVPVLGSESPDPAATYQVTVSLPSIFPETTGVALRILGTDASACAAAAHRDSAAAYGAQGWVSDGPVTTRITVGHLEVGYVFVGTVGNSSRRQLVTFEAKTELVPRFGLPGEQWPLPAEAPEDLYMRRVLLGDRLRDKQRWWLAQEAYERARQQFAERSLAPSKKLQVWLEASPPDKELPGNTPQWPVDERSNALFAMVRDIGDAARLLGADADSGRASAIRRSRDLLFGLLTEARAGAAELAAAAGDMNGAERLVNASLAEVEHLGDEHKKGLWEAGQLFLRTGAWDAAARYLFRLSSLDPDSWIVLHTLSGALANAGRLQDARQQLHKALEADSEEPGTSLLLLAEVTLSLEGCSSVAEVHTKVDQAVKLGAPTDGRAEVLRALGQLCADDVESAMLGFDSGERCGVLLGQCLKLLGHGGRSVDLCEALPCAARAGPR